MIKQRLPYDCGVCTVAMALGRTYEEAMAAANAEEAISDRGMSREYSVIEHFGLEQMRDFRILHRGVLAPEFFLHFTWCRRAILAVPSLNIEGGFHSVYWDGRQIFDPSVLKTYARWDELRPEEIILFADVAGPRR